MTELEYTAEINRLNGLKSAALVRASEYTTSANQWQAQASALTCNQVLAKNKAACNADKTYKQQNADNNRSLAAAEMQNVAQLTNQIQALVQARANEATTANEVSQVLANQGTTSEAVQTLANAQAEAQLQSSLINANTQASIAEKDAAVDTDAKKKAVMIGVAIAIVVVVILGIVIYKKYKKSK
jgi:hypothetical protein